MQDTLSPQIDETPLRRDEVVAPTKDKSRGRLHQLARREGVLLSGFVVLGFLLRLGLLLGFDSIVTPDGVWYVTLGWNLINGNFHWGLNTYWPPLYPLLIGIASLFFDDVEFGGRVVSLLAGSLVVLPAYVLIRDWYGRRVATLGALLVVLHPVLIYYSTLLLTEATYTLFYTCGILAGWRALTRGRKRTYALAGLAFGACYLLKPEATGYILLLLGLTLAAKFKGQRLRGVLLNALSLLAGYLLLASPYLIYLRRATGRWTISNKLYAHMWQGGGRYGDLVLHGGFLPGTSEMVVQLTKALRAEYEILNLIFPVLVVVQAALGLFRTRWTKERARKELYLFLFIAATVAGYAVTLPNIRFFAAMLPLLVFFKTYTEKVWGIPCGEIRAEWAAQRIKDLSLLKAIKSLFFKQTAPGKQGVIKTLIEEFDYPQLGPGMMWDAMAGMIEEQGGEIRRRAHMEKILCAGGRVEAVEIQTEEGREVLHGSDFISSMPLRELVGNFSPAAPREVLEAATNLHYRDFLIVVLIIDRADVFPDNWIYIHDPEVKVGRIQNFKNWSPQMVADAGKTCLGMEYFCFEGDGLWALKDEELIELGKRELEKLRLVQASEVKDGTVARVHKAYPVYDSTYREALAVVRGFLEGFENLQVVGRNGMHKYNNQDHSMLTAMLAVKNILGENHDLWQVNADQEYLEEMRDETPHAATTTSRAHLASTQPFVPERIQRPTVPPLETEL